MPLTLFPRPRTERELSALGTLFFKIKHVSIKLKIIIFIFSKIVKGVNAQDSGSSATELVALADNGVGVVARLPNGEGGEIRKKRED